MRILENSKENRCLPQLCTWKIGFCLAVARSIDNYKIEKDIFHLHDRNCIENAYTLG